MMKNNSRIYLFICQVILASISALFAFTNITLPDMPGRILTFIICSLAILTGSIIPLSTMQTQDTKKWRIPIFILIALFSAFMFYEIFIQKNDITAVYQDFLIFYVLSLLGFIPKQKYSKNI